MNTVFSPPVFSHRSGASQMRFPRVLLALLPAVALAACSDISGKATAASNPPLAYVRYFNAVGDTLPLDFRPIDQIEYSTPFLAVP